MSAVGATNILGNVVGHAGESVSDPGGVVDACSPGFEQCRGGRVRRPSHVGRQVLSLTRVVHVERLSVQQYKPCFEALSAVATQSYVRKLTLDYRHPEKDWVDNIPVDPLQHVTNLTLLNVPPAKLEWFKAFITQCSTLRVLDVNPCTHDRNPLDIRQVLPSERSPSSSLTEVRINWAGLYGFSFPEEAAGCMQNLTALHLEVRSHREELDPFWKAMGTRGVRLQVMEVSAITQALVDYLVSYSGLRHLRIGWRGSPCDSAEAMQLADEMYGVVVRSHEETLMTMGIMNHLAPHEKLWGINEHRLRNLLRGRKLQSLDLIVGAPELSLVRFLPAPLLFYTCF